MFCWQNDSNVSLFWWNDNNSLLSKLFQWFSYWNHSARVSLFWFCLANVNVDFFSRLVSKSPYIFVYIITFWNYTTKSNKKIIYFHKSVRHQVPPVLKSTFKFRILTPNQHSTEQIQNSFSSQKVQTKTTHLIISWMCYSADTNFISYVCFYVWFKI